MVLATGFLTFLWSLIVIFFMVAYFILLFQVLGDLIRRHDASGGKKALWVVFLVVFPYVGVLSYYVTNGRAMADRAARSAREAEEAVAAYVRDVAGANGGRVDQVAKAKKLLDAGAISQDEFERLKAKALA